MKIGRIGRTLQQSFSSASAVHNTWTELVWNVRSVEVADWQSKLVLVVLIHVLVWVSGTGTGTHADWYWQWYQYWYSGIFVSWECVVCWIGSLELYQMRQIYQIYQINTLGKKCYGAAMERLLKGQLGNPDTCAECYWGSLLSALSNPI